MLDRLLPINIFAAILKNFDVEQIAEVRLRCNAPVTVCCNAGYKLLTFEGQPVIASRDDILSVVSIAAENSVYAVNDAIKKCFLYYGAGVRIGLSGEGVFENYEKISTVKNISSLCIRIPHQVFGCLKQYSYISDIPQNTLIISPPAGGKTTLLRELARLASYNGYNTLFLDERRELAAVTEGVPSLDIGPCSDVLTGIPKKLAYENAVRTLNPEIIVIDELFGREEAHCVADIARCGVKFFATLHSANLESVLNSEYNELIALCKYVFVLSKRPNAGNIAAFYDVERDGICLR